MLYKITKRNNPLKKSEWKFYAAPAYGEEISIRELAREISESCSLTVSDVVGVLESLLAKLPAHLKASNKVRLGDFGIMKLSFSSKGQEKAEDVSSRDVKDVHVLFTPGVEFKKELTDVGFFKRDASENQEAGAKKASPDGKNAGAKL